MIVKEWKPTARQEDFLSLPDTIFEALYGGAAGGGKSECLLLLPIIKRDKQDKPLYEHPRFKMLFLRRTFPELDNEIIPRSKDFYPSCGFLPYQDQKKRWTHPSGAIIQFGHCEHEKDVMKYDTSEYNIISFDEATSFTPYQYEYLTFSRCRSSSSDLPAIVRGGTNPGNVGHCVPYGEVLTPNGWRDISSFEVGDEVYEVDPNRMALVESTIEQVHVHEFKGCLWNTTASNLDMICTPEHTVLRQKKPKNTYILTAVQNLPGQAHIARTIEDGTYDWPDIFVLPGNELGRFNQPKEIPYLYYAELMGWYLSEGYVLSDEAQKGQGKFFAISQEKQHYRDRIQSLLVCCGFKYSSDESQFRVYSPSWYEYFKQFGKSRDKFIPRELLNCNRLLQRALFTSLMAGDGHIRNENSGIYYTISKQLADDFSELAFKLGYRVKITIKQHPNRVGPAYQIAYDSNKVTEILTGQHTYNVNTEIKRIKNTSCTPYDGLVYDIGVPLYHTFVIRQNGSIWISGNSYFRKRFVEPARLGNTILRETRVVRGQSQTILRIFIPSKATDNTYLMKADPDYINRLNRLPDAERAAKADGDWWTFSGQVFDEWRITPFPDEPANACHIAIPFRIPDYWPKVLAMDWGYSAMTIAGWYAINPCPSKQYPAQIYKYREYSCKKTKISTWASDIARLSQGEEYLDVVLDPSAWAERGEPASIADQFAQYSGMNPRKADNDRLSGKLLIQDLLRWKPRPARFVPQTGFDQELALQINRRNGPKAYEEYCALFLPEAEEQFLPRFQIFADQCPETEKVIPICVYDKDKKEDVAEFDGDDPYDETRYGLKACQYFLDHGKAKHEELAARAATASLLENGAISQTHFYARMNTIESKFARSNNQAVKRFHGPRLKGANFR